MLLKTNIFKIIFVIALMFLIIAYPSLSADGVCRGLQISANVIVPSLFPFMVCILMLTKSEITINVRNLNNLLYKFFGQNFNMFFVFVLSLIGGYPIGAVMIAEMYKNKQISSNIANIMITYCVNAGPAFIIFIAGNSFKSKSIGIVLFFANMLASILLMILSIKTFKSEKTNYTFNTTLTKNIFENFFESIADSCNSVIRISAFIVFFSVINSYIEYFFANVPILCKIQYFTEITFAVTNCKNIYFVSFLISFSGLSIWCQIFALLKDLKINIKKFIFSRIIHGLLSMCITFLMINVFRIKLFTFNNGINFNYKTMYSDVSLLLSMIIMSLTLSISIFCKNNSGKITNDVL